VYCLFSIAQTELNTTFSCLMRRQFWEQVLQVVSKKWTIRMINAKYCENIHNF